MSIRRTRAGTRSGYRFYGPDTLALLGLVTQAPPTQQWNLQAVQEHLWHADIQTTTVYTRLTQSDLQKVISDFDKDDEDEHRGSQGSMARRLTP